MIHLEGITKSFGSLQVLKGIDLEITQGEGKHRGTQWSGEDYFTSDNGYFGQSRCGDDKH